MGRFVFWSVELVVLGWGGERGGLGFVFAVCRFCWLLCSSIVLACWCPGVVCQYCFQSMGTPKCLHSV